MFEPGHCQWASSEKERQDNERFYRSFDQPSEPMKTCKKEGAKQGSQARVLVNSHVEPNQ